METGRPAPTGDKGRQERGFRWRLSLGLLALAFLTPLGIILPRLFHAEETWGEWEPEHLGRLLGYVPGQLMRGAHIWTAPAVGYSFAKGGACLGSRSFFYIIAGLAGLTLVGLAVVLLARLVRPHDR